MHSTNYIIRFVLIMTVIVALILAFLQNALKPVHDNNEAAYNKRAILSAISDHLPNSLEEMTDEDVLDIFNNKMEQIAVKADGSLVGSDEIEAAGYKGGKPENIDMKQGAKKPVEDRLFPVYIYSKENGEKLYILSVRGKGLWDEIWGSIALQGDINTIAGVAFDHKGETPGLGAEIKDNPDFYNQFTGKKIYREGELESVYVRKGGAKDEVYEVDGISGATITADGVTEMMKRGLGYYQPYLETLKG